LLKDKKDKKEEINYNIYHACRQAHAGHVLDLDYGSCSSITLRFNGISGNGINNKKE